MKQYTIVEASEKLNVHEARLYSYIRKIEERTNYRFVRKHCGHYAYGKPVMQKVVSECELDLLREMIEQIKKKNGSYSPIIKQLFISPLE